MVAPFTSPPALQTIGPQIHAGAAAWIAHYNAQGGHRGRPVQLLVRDGGYDVVITAAAIRKFVEQDKVIALLSSNGTPQLKAAMPYVQAHRLPVLLPFAGDDDWFHLPQWGVFGVQAPFNDISYLLGRWAALAGHSRVTVLHPHYPEISPRLAP